MISCIRSVWKCSQMLSLYSVVGGAQGGSNDLNFFNSINRLVSVRFSHFFSFFLISSYQLLYCVVL